MCGESSQSGLITPCEVGGSRNAAGVTHKSVVHYVTQDPPGSKAATPPTSQGRTKTCGDIL
jgi:hypothetical protein